MRIISVFLVSILFLACNTQADEERPFYSDLRIEKIANAENVSTGTVVRFTIAIQNQGARDAFNVSICSLLPPAYSYIDSSVTDGEYDPVTGIWYFNWLGRSQIENMIIDASLNATGAHSFKTEIISSDSPDPDSTPNNNIESEDDQVTLTVTGS